MIMCARKKERLKKERSGGMFKVEDEVNGSECGSECGDWGQVKQVMKGVMKVDVMILGN